jgi:hypothetical protein
MIEVLSGNFMTSFDRYLQIKFVADWIPGALGSQQTRGLSSCGLSQIGQAFTQH